ncbi:hypothetical protein TRICI_006672 [Trichomonascus ciferrii]|uniref:Pentacotripeptide-repeat region of PRORP domain-containing protein n=1 Tax=Trichomonascus ciferrii TaxID=44093 RepID=A0A642UH84_9ASCO|nr:hypothetical protein TRICI_006672 [Trichomonascus ciferrii]
MSRYMALCNEAVLSHRREALKWSMQVLSTEITSSKSILWSRSWLSASLGVDLQKLPVRRTGTSRPVRRVRLRTYRFPSTIVARGCGSIAFVGRGCRNVGSAAVLNKPLNRQAELNELEDNLANSRFENFQRCWELWTELVMNGDEDVRRLVLKWRRNFYIFLSRSSVEKAKCFKMIENMRFYVPDGLLRDYDYTNLINVLVYRHDINGIRSMMKECLEKTSVYTTLEVLKWAVSRIHKSGIQTSKIKAQFDLYISTMLLIRNSIGVLDQKKYQVERNILRKVLLGGTPKAIVRVLDGIIDGDKVLGGTFASACMHVLATWKEGFFPKLEEEIFLLKKRRRLANSRDLSILMEGCLVRNEGERALNLYEHNKEYHSDEHFDLLLQSYAQLGQWGEMQELFESLFGRGELPSQEHYRIVMESLSRIARKDIVDTLFEGFLSRRFTPNVNILNALMYSRLAFGDTEGVEKTFGKFDEFSIVPNDQSFLIRLLAYRDAKDLESAMGILKQLQTSNPSLLSIEIFTTLMSLCTERRDAVKGQEIFTMVRRFKIEPNLVFYNAYLACLTASNQHRKAFSFYGKLINNGYRPDVVTITTMLSCAVRMKREHLVNRLFDDLLKFKVAPDAKWYSVMLDFFVDKGQLKQAEEIFEEMKRTKVPLDCHHYTILMDGYASQNTYRRGGGRPNYNRVADLYNEMISNGIDPTFKAHATYVEALSRLSPLGEKGTQMLEDFLGSESIIDLTSDQLSRDKVPPRLIKPLIKGALRKKRIDRAKEILRFYISSPKGFGYNNIQVLLLGIEVHRREQNWSMVAKLWDRLMTILPKTFVQTPERKRLRNDRANRHILPGRNQHSLTRAVNAKMMQLKQQGEIYDVLPLARNLEYHGVHLTSSNLNYLVEALISDDKFIFKGFEITEQYLMKGFTFRIWKAMHGIRNRHFEPRRQVNVPTLRQLTAVYRRALLITCRKYNVSETKAFGILRKRYPRLIFALEKRVERGRELRITRPSENYTINASTD